MLSKKSTLLIVLTLFLVAATNTLVFTNEAQPSAGHTGAPGENTCATSGCHGGTAVTTTDIAFNTAPAGQLTNGYTPGQLYNLTINLNNLVTPTTTTPKDGFQITALDANADSAGTFSLTTPNSTVLDVFFDRQYVGHKNANSTNAWVFKWTAPAAGTGPVTFYIAANRSNNSGSNSGDNIYKQSFTFNEATVNPCTNFNVSISTLGNANSFCAGESLDLTANTTGGTATSTYAWSGGAGSTQTVTVSTAATYTVTATNNGCTATASIAVSSVASGVADFSVTVDDNVVTINNNSTGADGNYTWNFGDGTEFADNSASFSYTYDSLGFYTIVLSYTDVCGNTQTATEQFTINVISSVGQPSLADALSVYPNPFGSQASININGYNGLPYQFTLVDVTGKAIFTAQGIGGTPLVVDRNGLPSGMYFYSIVAEGQSAQGKLLID